MLTRLRRELLDEFCGVLETDVNMLGETVASLSGVKLTLTEAEMETRVSLIADARNYQNSPYAMSDAEKMSAYRQLFTK